MPSKIFEASSARPRQSTWRTIECGAMPPNVALKSFSEASRRIPDAWKSAYPEIPWQKIAGIGSVIRHNYENVNPTIIAELNGAPLAGLERVVLALLDKHDPDGRPFRKR
jgi:hypothetical protein